MKKFLFSLFLIWTISSITAQEIRFYVHGQSQRSVTKETIKTAKTMNDLLPGYPSNWISSYTSVELFLKQDNKTIGATGINEILNQEQLALLKSAELNSEVKIEIKYDYLNPLTIEVEKNNILVLLTVIPESRAEFVGGDKELNRYLTENCSKRIPESMGKTIRSASLKFVVNEEGRVINPVFTRSSGNADVDQILLESLSKMPNWKPAEDANGNKVQQEFVLDMNPKGSGGC